MKNCIAVSTFTFVSCILAQTPTSLPGVLTPANLPVQAIGVGDLLTVSAYGAPELSRSVRVSQDGMIRLPMLQSPIKAVGLLPSDLEKNDRGRTAARKYLGRSDHHRNRQRIPIAAQSQWLEP